MFDIITIGTATRDVFLTSPFFKVLRDKNHLKKIGFETGEAQCFALGGKIEVGKPILATGGGATNAATTFSRQGLKTATLVKIGNDSAGREILSELKNEKIDVLPLNSNNDTAYSTILLASGGERTILVYRGVSENLNAEETPFDKLKAKWVYVSPGKMPFETINKIFNHFYSNGAFIAFNPSKYFIEMGLKKIKPLLKKTKVFILNREEASHLTGIDYYKEKEIFKKFDEAIDGIAVMTDGENDVLISDCCNIYKAGVFKERAVVDRTGAGDAFGSGFVAGLIQTREKCDKSLSVHAYRQAGSRQGLCGVDNIKYAIRLGSANATSVIEQIGAKAGILTKKEFEKNKRWKNLKIKKYSGLK